MNTNEDAKVSILLPIYNVEKYVARCLDSIVNQTYKNIEIILVDDCSEDNSLDICYDYAKKDERIKIIKKSSHTVLSDVRNVGIENANGKYIMFVDSDDYVESNFVEEMVKAIEENDVDVVRCKAKKYTRNGTIDKESFYGYENKKLNKDEINNLIINLITYNNVIKAYSWALIIKKEILTVKFNPSVYSRQDTVFFVEFLLENASSIYFLDKELYHYCFNNNGITQDEKNYNRYVNSVLISNEEIIKVLKKNNMFNEKIERKINNTAIMLILYKQISLINMPVTKINKVIKNTFKDEKVKKVLKKMDLNDLVFRKKIEFILVKMHLYFLIALHIKTIK